MAPGSMDNKVKSLFDGHPKLAIRKEDGSESVREENDGDSTSKAAKASTNPDRT
jgi:hypothetical protein